MPSVNSSSMPKVFDSSMVTTPSLPTLSMASASTSPMAASAAELPAIWAISLLSSISLASSLMESTAAATAFSMPRFSPRGLAPAATLRRPSRTSAWARTVAVVVPSPAMSLVLVATSFTSWAPMFSKGSSSSISRAMDTPSLVMVGAPHFLSSTTLRPFGPSVTFTASASLLTPVSRARRAWSSNLRILGISASLRDDGEHVARRQDEHVVALDRDLGAAVLAVQDGVADAHADGDDLAGLLGALARADGQDLALLRLFLGGVGDDQATRGGLLALTGLHDDPIVEGLQVHACRLHWRSPANPGWVSSLPMSSANARPRRLAVATRECQSAHHVGLAGVSRPMAGAGWGWRRCRAVTARRSAAATTRRRRSWRRCRCTSTGWGRTAGCRPRRTPRPGASATCCWPPPRPPGTGPWRPRRGRPFGPWRRARRRRPPESWRRRRPWRRRDASG